MGCVAGLKYGVSFARRDNGYRDITVTCTAC